MTEISNRKFLQACIAKICQNVGWNFIQATPLELLTDLVRDFIVELGKSANMHALHCGSREPNLDHLALTFEQFGISVSDLKDYVRYVDSSCISEVPLYPVPSDQYLNHLKPGSREVVTRAFHIHEHLPPMHPHLEDQELSLKHSPLSIDSIPENSSPACSPKAGLFKRPGEPLSESFSAKRTRYLPEEEGRPLRELTSVMMTTSGFLSPAREGKLPEARTPVIKPDLLNSDVSNSNSTPETKPEKKKKLKSSSSDAFKKNEKDTRNLNEDENELPLKEDEKITKKLIGVKDNHKPKAQKQPNTSPKTISHLPTASPTVKQHKTIGAKKASTLNSGVTSNITSKKSPKNEKAVLTLNQKDAQTSVGYPLASNSEYKISSEPDKQKLNILKKISKVKEETIEEPSDKGGNEQVSLAQIDFTIESVIKREMISEESDDVHLIDVKEEVVDIETVPSPNPHSSLMTSSSYPVSLANVPAPAKPEKRKKKEKVKAKKDNVDKCEQDTTAPTKNVKNVINMTAEHDSLKPKVEEAEEEIVPVLVTPSPLPTAPGLIPTLVPSLIPSILEPFSKMEHNITVPKGQILPSSSLPLESAWNPSSYHPEAASSLVIAPVLGKSSDHSQKKKEHKKDKKEKVKKKKKDKIKSKDKSEKKKLKLEKKEKDKVKGKKEKKGKKKDKEGAVENKNDPGNAVPKITLKLTPASPTDNSADASLRMIVIKKEAETVVKQERSSSPELAKFSPLIPPTKHKASKAHTPEPVKATFSNNAGTPNTPSLPPSVRLDSEGNQVWICPACEKQDDGSPMVGCDGCDAWYHWVCVGIQVPPETSLWYCNNCLIKQKTNDSEKRKKNKRKSSSKKVKGSTA